MVHRVIASVVALAFVFSPLLARAGTNVRSINGVQVITFERDAPTHVGHHHIARRATLVTAASVHPTIVAPAPELRGASTIVRNAMSYVGTPYVWGGSAPGGFDCSGFIYYLYAQAGLRIPRTADYQFAAGRPVVGDPLPGDLVFFQTYEYGASHVGLYLGSGRFINSIGENVHVASFASNYFRSRYLGARRFLSS
jgi:cell wall-associated NlpC family hydrolase